MPGIKAHKSLKINTQNNGTPHTSCRVTDHMLFQVFTGQLGSLFCLHVPSTGVWITMFKYSCWLTKMCLRSHKFAMLIRYLPVLWRFTWDQTLLEGVCVCWCAATAVLISWLAAQWRWRWFVLVTAQIQSRHGELLLAQHEVGPETWVDLEVTSRISNLWTCIHQT